MGNRNLRRSRMATVNIVDAQHEKVVRVPNGRQHLAVFVALRLRLDEMTERQALGPVADPASLMLVEHVQLTSTVASALDAFRKNPLGDPEDQAAAQRLYSATVEGRIGPSVRMELRAEHADLMTDRRDALAADLARFPAVAGQPSLAQLVDEWIALGVSIGHALGERKRLASSDRLGARALIAETQQAITRLRRAIQMQVELAPGADPNLESEILGYTDGLATQSKRRAPRDVTCSPMADANPTPDSQADSEVA